MFFSFLFVLPVIGGSGFYIFLELFQTSKPNREPPPVEGEEIEDITIDRP